ncbi:hypothetical protein O181_009855 [Austropuccinia psidii MF-1]|uniref:Uncharacterized protein n=1 Tax=Austropuccinia psidii MF-1 TaxID=1389203 RepID=A0A9Q3GKB4_9BASI|nr:hypothetical protein [Austropuccinia psidii MF-1]
MRGKKKKVAIRRRSLLLMDPIPQGLLKTHYQRGLIRRRTRRASSFNPQRTSPMLLSSIRAMDKLLASEKERRIEKGCIPIVVESTQLQNASRDLRTSLGHYQEASLESREKPEWGS